MCARKNAQQLNNENGNPQQLNNARNVKNAQPQKKRATTKRANYNLVIVKLVRLFCARPAAVAFVAMGSVLPNPL